MPAIPWPSLAPWHFAVAAVLVCLAALWLTRVQADRALDDFSNAFFYAPSQKEKHRQRHRRWRDFSRLALAATAIAVAVAALLYVQNGRVPPAESPPQEATPPPG